MHGVDQNTVLMAMALFMMESVLADMAAKSMERITHHVDHYRQIAIEWYMRRMARPVMVEISTGDVQTCATHFCSCCQWGMERFD